MNQYPANQFLITCRIAASDYSFDSFTYVEVADFDDQQIRVFVTKWFKDNPIKRDRLLEEFVRSENEGLRELASIPLLLTLLCLAFDETMTFPQRRVEIYEEAIDALLKKWDASRNIKRDDIYRKLSLGRKRQMLARIAAESFETGDYFLSQSALEKRIVDYLQRLPPTDTNEDIDGAVILKAIEAQHGLLIERAWHIYSFSHLSFQEYFTAKYIADNASSGTLHGLIKHINDDRWREVFLLTASLLDKADDFFELLKRAIDMLIHHDEQMIALLNWVEKMATSLDTTASYPARARALDWDITSIVDSCSRNLAFGRIRDIGYSRSCALDIAQNAGLDRAFNLVLAFDLLNFE